MINTSNKTLGVELKTLKIKLKSKHEDETMPGHDAQEETRKKVLQVGVRPVQWFNEPELAQLAEASDCYSTSIGPNSITVHMRKEGIRLLQ